MNKPEPLAENEGKGFHYTVTDEQIMEHQKRSIMEIFEWLQSANALIYAAQTPEERERTQKVKRGEL
jgi:hypothetical protein